MPLFSRLSLLSSFVSLARTSGRVGLLMLVGLTLRAGAALGQSTGETLVFGPAELNRLRLNDTVQVVTGRTVAGVDTDASRGVLLGDVSRTNLALGRPVTASTATGGTPSGVLANLTDGAPTFVSFLRTQGVATLTIDLQGQQQVKRIDITAFSVQAGLVGYSISVSADSALATARFTEVVPPKQSPTPLALVSEVLPQAVDARLVRLTLTAFPAGFNVILREIQVFGEGFIPNGTYVLGPYVLPAPRNLGRVSYSGTLPPGTSASVRVLALAPAREDSVAITKVVAGKPVVRYKRIPFYDVLQPEGAVLTDSLGGSPYRVPEPVTAFALEVRLSSVNSRITPALREIRVVADRPVVTGVVASLSPDTVQILRRQTFTLGFDLTPAPGDLGLDSLGLDLPAPVTVRDIRFNGTSVLQGAAVDNRSRSLGVRFGQTLTAAGRLELVVETQPFEATNPFAARLYSQRTPTNPQQVALGTPATVLVTTGVPEAVFIDLEFRHNPLIRPSVDRQLEMHFYLAKIEVARRLLVRIYDLRGRELRTVFDQATTANAFIGADAIRWDGRDGTGRLVPPGAYLVRLELETDESPTIVTRTAVVAY